MSGWGSPEPAEWIKPGSPARQNVLVPYMVLMTCTSQAVKLYCIITQHVSTGNPTPSRAELAVAMGFDRTKSVDAYITELSDMGIIEVMREQGRGARNSYAIKWTAAAA